jgi:hypothetical protein
LTQKAKASGRIRHFNGAIIIQQNKKGGEKGEKQT